MISAREEEAISPQTFTKDTFCGSRRQTADPKSPPPLSPLPPPTLTLALTLATPYMTSRPTTPHPIPPFPLPAPEPPRPSETRNLYTILYTQVHTFSISAVSVRHSSAAARRPSDITPGSRPRPMEPPLSSQASLPGRSSSHKPMPPLVPSPFPACHINKHTDSHPRVGRKQMGVRARVYMCVHMCVCVE